jgi:hypothetical protein
MRDDRVPGERRTPTDREGPSLAHSATAGHGEDRHRHPLRPAKLCGSSPNLGGVANKMEDDMLSDQRNIIARRLFEVGKDR